MHFRLTVYDTTEENKYAADKRHEYLGSQEDIWHLWYILVRVCGKKHVEVFTIDGTRQDPEKGIAGMADYHL